jgi:hypothetical protein
MKIDIDANDNIYVVEDSLTNSFEFMKNTFDNKTNNDDKSSLDFF